jgi:hypothetical protein
MYTSTDQPLPKGKLLKFYECGICGHCHPLTWDGDCRDDSNRFTNQELDDKYGVNGWEEVPMSGSEEDAESEITPVVFRAERSGKFKGDVTAVMPCDPAGYMTDQMGCYAHVGQHSGCTHSWYVTTRAAKLAEYANLLKELESIGYRVKVYARIQPWMRDKRREAARGFK